MAQWSADLREGTVSLITCVGERGKRYRLVDVVDGPLRGLALGGSPLAEEKEQNGESREGADDATDGDVGFGDCREATLFGLEGELKGKEFGVDYADCDALGG